MADFSGIFRRPFREQAAAFRLRLSNLVPTARWDDISRAQHDRGFMVAGAMKADLLADLALAVDKAIEQGTSFDEFQRDFRAIVERRGWHGWTGEGTAKGEAWRMLTIYRTNMMTSYHAGRYAQLKEAGFPFWVYRHSGAAEPRELHLSWNGLILPADHEFWQTHYPPNGWGCGCYVTGARSRRAAERVGGNPAVMLPPNWKAIDPRTGAPMGIDRLWDYAPGASSASETSFLARKLDTLPDRVSIDLLQSWIAGGLFERWAANPVGNLPLARLQSSLADAVGATTRTVRMSPATYAKQRERHPEITISEYANAQRVISEAREVILDGDKALVFILDDLDAGIVLVVKATQSGEGLFITSVRRLSSDAARRDQALRQLRSKGRNVADDRA